MLDRGSHHVLLEDFTAAFALGAFQGSPRLVRIVGASKR